MPILLSLLACGPDFVEEQLDGFRSLTATLRADGEGTVRGSFEVLDGETALLVTGISEPDETTTVVGLADSSSLLYDGPSLYTSPRTLTSAIIPSGVSTLNWPPRGTDPDLVPGFYEVVLRTIDGDRYSPRSTVEVQILTKQDPDPTGGHLLIDLILVGDAPDSDELAETLPDALAEWERIYAQLGITLDVSTSTADMGDLEPPAFGSESEYEALSAGTRLGSVNVVITDEIVTSVPNVLGVAGDIPGPLVPSSRSAVLISYLEGMGPDGRFSREETRLLGETMAHETGHYLGLFHPVESLGWDNWDALDDTEECDDESSCLEALKNNLMFPVTVCGSFSCVAQDQLTPQQIGAANRYVGVD